MGGAYINSQKKEEKKKKRKKVFFNFLFFLAQLQSTEPYWILAQDKYPRDFMGQSLHEIHREVSTWPYPLDTAERNGKMHGQGAEADSPDFRGDIL